MWLRHAHRVLMLIVAQGVRHRLRSSLRLIERHSSRSLSSRRWAEVDRHAHVWRVQLRDGSGRRRGRSGSVRVGQLVLQLRCQVLDPRLFVAGQFQELRVGLREGGLARQVGQVAEPVDGAQARDDQLDVEQEG
jgi:hypothetical protein